MKNEIVHREILVLNDSSLLRILYNKIFSIEVVVSFSETNVPYVFLNAYNFGLLNFVCRPANNICINNVNSNEEAEIKQIDQNNTKLEYYDLKYV